LKLFEIVEEEKKPCLANLSKLTTTAFDGPIPEPLKVAPKVEIADVAAFEAWKKIECNPAKNKQDMLPLELKCLWRFLYRQSQIIGQFD